VNLGGKCPLLQCRTTPVYSVDLLRVSKALERHQSVVTILTDNSFIIGVLYKNLLVFCAVMYESTVYCFAVCQSFY